MSFLAQQTEIGPAFVMLGVLLTIVLSAGGILMWVRSRTLGGRNERTGGGIFEDLGRMRDAGEISDEEYAAAKRSVVDRMAGRTRSGSGARSSAAASSPRAGSRDAKVEKGEPGAGEGEKNPDEPTDERSDLRG